MEQKIGAEDSLVTGCCFGDIFNTSLPLFQLLVTAFDTGVPEITTSTIVTITITRNLNSPIFSANRYVENVYDYIGLGSNVLQITATDSDVTSPENSVIYDLQDNSGFFTIHPFNGMITVDRKLTEDTTRRTVYVVWHMGTWTPFIP